MLVHAYCWADLCYSIERNVCFANFLTAEVNNSENISKML